MGKYKSGDVFVIEIEKEEANKLYKIKGAYVCMPESVFDDIERYCKENSEVGSILSVKEKAFGDGMFAAWDVAKKITSLGAGELRTMFDTNLIPNVFLRFSPFIAKGIVEKYEEQKRIKEGDIVEFLEHKSVVLVIDGEIASVYVVDNDDGKVQEVEFHLLKKVGPSIDVKETLLRECVAATCEHARELRNSV